jgi:hypothetical protein
MLGAGGFAMQGRSANAATEDIAMVLGRFQAWAGSREAKARTNGVREISYEEALESSRHRWRDRGEDSRPREADQRESTGADAAAPIDAVHPPAVEEAANRTTVEAMAVPGVLPAERADSGNRPPFRAVLARSMETVRPARPVARGEGVSLSLRVNPAEQALIRIRAAEAGMSVSAYLRQCALDVEILRAQVQQFMAASARSRMAELPEPRPARSEGWLARLQGRIRGGRGAQVSLRT